MAAQSDTTLELRGDSQTGPLLGVCALTATGGAWATQTCQLTETSGVGRVFVSFGGAARLNWLKFQPVDGDAGTGAGDAGAKIILSGTGGGPGGSTGSGGSTGVTGSGAASGCGCGIGDGGLRRGIAGARGRHRRLIARSQAPGSSLAASMRPARRTQALRAYYDLRSLMKHTALVLALFSFVAMSLGGCGGDEPAATGAAGSGGGRLEDTAVRAAALDAAGRMARLERRVAPARRVRWDDWQCRHDGRAATQPARTTQRHDGRGRHDRRRRRGGGRGGTSGTAGRGGIGGGAAGSAEARAAAAGAAEGPARLARPARPAPAGAAVYPRSPSAGTSCRIRAARRSSCAAARSSTSGRSTPTAA